MTDRIEISTNARPGGQGFPGWSPVLATVVDGTRIVVKVSDWTGGQGTKPATNQYISPTGYTASIAAATDIRGASDVADVIFTNFSNMVLKNHCTYLANGAGTTFSFPTLTPMGFEFDLINNHQYGASLTLPAGAILRKPASRSVGTSFESVSWQIVSGTTFDFPLGLFKVKVFVAAGPTILIYIF
jgi:hypothetical protein